MLAVNSQDFYKPLNHRPINDYKQNQNSLINLVSCVNLISPGQVTKINYLGYSYAVPKIPKSNKLIR